MIFTSRRGVKNKNLCIMKKIKNYLCLLVLVVAIISCKKKPHIEPEPDPEVVIPGAVKTPHAELVGTAVSQTIGAAGGTLTVPNSQLKLVIPPGAVDKDINFSVQEVKQRCRMEVFLVTPIVSCLKMYNSKKTSRL